MKRQFVLLATLIFIFTSAATALQQDGTTTKIEFPAMEIGKTLTDFTLTELNGKSRTLESLKGKKGTLLIFVSTKCPYSNSYNERMEQVAQEYQSRGLSVVGINANAKESADDVKAHASANRLSFTIFKDHQNKIADYLGAKVTPEAFLLDPSNKLVYHGRVDNSRDLTKVKTRELRDALDALLAGKQIERPTALAFGCTIQRVI